MNRAALRRVSPYDRPTWCAVDELERGVRVSTRGRSVVPRRRRGVVQRPPEGHRLGRRHRVGERGGGGGAGQTRAAAAAGRDRDRRPAGARGGGRVCHWAGRHAGPRVRRDGLRRSRRRLRHAARRRLVKQRRHRLAKRRHRRRHRRRRRRLARRLRDGHPAGQAGDRRERRGRRPDDTRDGRRRRDGRLHDGPCDTPAPQLTTSKTITCRAQKIYKIHIVTLTGNC